MPGCVVEGCLGSCMNIKNNPMQCAQCLTATVPKCTESFISCTGFEEKECKEKNKVYAGVMTKYFELHEA